MSLYCSAISRQLRAACKNVAIALGLVRIDAARSQYSARSRHFWTRGEASDSSAFVTYSSPLVTTPIPPRNGRPHATHYTDRRLMTFRSVLGDCLCHIAIIAVHWASAFLCAFTKSSTFLRKLGASTSGSLAPGVLLRWLQTSCSARLTTSSMVQATTSKRVMISFGEW